MGFTLTSLLPGDAGTATAAATTATVVITIGIQNSHRYPRTSTIGPARINPMPPPAETSALMVPTAPGIRAFGNSSRMMAKLSGRTPPPSPWITRATISTLMLVETAARNDPAASPARVTTSIRFLPTRSPIRPVIGVNTDAESRYVVRTQDTVD